MDPHRGRYGPLWGDGLDMYILRHGETLWNVEGRMQGGLDSPLTGRGRDQARQQGEILRREGADGLPVLCSPQARALETARIALPGCVPVSDDRLAELGMGDWQGRTLSEIRSHMPDALPHPSSFLWKFSAPAGETIAQMRARVAAFAREAPDDCIVITHGVTSQFLRGHLLGLDLEGTDALGDRQGVVYRIRDGVPEVLKP